MVTEADLWCSWLWRCGDEIGDREGRCAWHDLRGSGPDSCADLTAVFPAHGSACHTWYWSQSQSLPHVVPLADIEGRTVVIDKPL